MEQDDGATRPLRATDLPLTSAWQATPRDSGSRIGPYALEGMLGRGGNGIVYRARHGATGELAALKTVLALRPDALGGLRREILALRRLHHPNVVRVLEDGVTDDGAPWYAMELLPGRSLRMLVPDLERGRPAWTPDALRAQLEPILSVCAALEHIHGEGIVHRDLKPENVLVAADGRAVVTDLGVAVSFAAPSRGDRLDALGEIAGTVWYMAPEQLAGSLVDARADIYALGCILHELVTGEPPFPGQEPLAVVSQHMLADPPPMSRRAEGVPPKLDALVRQMLRKAPRERYGHAVDVGAALRVLLGPGGPTAGAPGTARPYLYRSDLFGRDEPLETIRARMDDAVRGRGSCLLVEGEAGIGKTRLLLEAARRAAPELLVLSGGCRQGGEGFHPLRAPLDAIADWAEADPSDVATRLLAEGAAVLAPLSAPLAALARRCGVTPVPLPTGQREARSRLCRALTRVLALVADVRPLLLILDDIHWADDLTLSFLAGIDLRTIGKQRMTVVGALRPAEALDGLRRAWSDVTSVRLEGLPEDAVARILGDMLALPDLAPHIVATMAASSGGSPGILVEQAGCLVEESHLVRDAEGRWRLGGSPDLSPDPAALASRRVARRSEPARRLLRATALAGGDASARVLEAIAGLDADDARAAQHELIAAWMIEEVAPELLRLSRDEIGRAALDELGPEERISWHTRAATILEKLAGDEPQLAGTIAEHWKRAGEREKERPWRWAAAKRAVDRFALAEAERQYRAHIETFDGPTEDLVSSRCNLGWEVLTVLGRNAESEAQHRIALEEARALGNAPLEVVALRRLFLDLHSAGALEASREYITRSLELARASGLPMDEAHALNSMSMLETDLGHPAEAVRCSEAAVAIYEAHGDVINSAVASGNLGVLHLYLGDVARGAALTEKAVDILRRTARPWIAVRFIANLGAIRSIQGRAPEAEALLRESIATAKETGYQQALGECIRALATSLRQVERLDEARVAALQAGAIAREIADASSELDAEIELSRVLLAQGDVPGALALAERGAVLAAGRKEPRQSAEALSALADVLRRSSAGTARARACLDEALAVTRDSGMPLLELPLRTMRAAVGRRMGMDVEEDLARARTLLEGAGLDAASPLAAELRDAESTRPW